MDWSYAGYKAGETGLPNVAVAADVKKWGAKGDGWSDDTDAIQRAVDSIKSQGALYFPPGAARRGAGELPPAHDRLRHDACRARTVVRAGGSIKNSIAAGAMRARCPLRRASWSIR
jgi:hypothetical protein